MGQMDRNGIKTVLKIESFLKELAFSDLNWK